jgi:hypothetical protein
MDCCLMLKKLKSHQLSYPSRLAHDCVGVIVKQETKQAETKRNETQQKRNKIKQKRNETQQKRNETNKIINK